MISTSQTVHYGEEESPVTSVRKRSSRLSMRKGRSIVHKNLEDNYGAVITANHEAIAQILEQVAKIYKKYFCSTVKYILSGLSKPAHPSEPAKPRRCHESASCRFLRPQRVRGVAHREARLLPRNLGSLTPARHPDGQQGHGPQQHQRQELLRPDPNRPVR